MANEVKEETEDRFYVHVAKYEADGFTNENARKEAELMMLTVKLCTRGIRRLLRAFLNFTKVNYTDPL